MNFKKPGLLFLASLFLITSRCSGSSTFGFKEFKKELDALKVEYKVLNITNQDDFFSISPIVMEIKGKRIYLYDFKNEKAMEKEAEKVDSGGCSIGNFKISWVSTPHFFKKGSIILQYIGNDKAMVNTFKQIMGTQFAGMD